MSGCGQGSHRPRASPNRDRRRILPAVRHRGLPSLADDDQLAIERFDDDGNTTGPGLAPVGYSLHALHFLTLFRNGKGLRVGVVGTAAHQFRALASTPRVAQPASPHACCSGARGYNPPTAFICRPSCIAGERSTRSNGNQN